MRQIVSLHAVFDADLHRGSFLGRSCAPRIARGILAANRCTRWAVAVDSTEGQDAGAARVGLAGCGGWGSGYWLVSVAGCSFIPFLACTTLLFGIY
jgi:hypothetical protein